VTVTKTFVTITQLFCDYLLTQKYLLLSQSNFVDIILLQPKIYFVKPAKPFGYI